MPKSDVKSHIFPAGSVRPSVCLRLLLVNWADHRLFWRTEGRLSREKPLKKNQLICNPLSPQSLLRQSGLKPGSFSHQFACIYLTVCRIWLTKKKNKVLYKVSLTSLSSPSSNKNWSREFFPHDIRIIKICSNWLLFILQLFRLVSWAAVLHSKNKKVLPTDWKMIRIDKVWIHTSKKKTLKWFGNTELLLFFFKSKTLYDFFLIFSFIYISIYWHTR